MSTQREAVITTQDKTKELVIDALFIALTFAATMFINIRLPLMGNGGLIHLGNVPMFLGAFIFGKRTGALAGGIGMGLFDLISGWTAWAPFTLVIVGLMGYVSGLISEKLKVRPIIANTVAVIAALIMKALGSKTKAAPIVASIAGEAWMVLGYFLYESIFLGYGLAAAGSIGGNAIQAVAGVILAAALYAVLSKVPQIKKAAA